MNSPTLVILFTLLVASIAGCGPSMRETLMAEKYPTYPPEIREAIDKHHVLKGMDQAQVQLALGETPCVTSRTAGDKTYMSWTYWLDKSSYEVIEPSRCFDRNYSPYTVFFENGRVTHWDY